ncbi:MAG: tRNA pseudouridine(38-40) synthase TruA [Flavobacteriales bacterium]|uniref:tRNA pseudouridine(38-40) synthase TruA n=1 Tax=Blattabacterium sp. (Mastotermes darwiniensis) TaxID=39768 RepID=UPI000231DF3D|nr:tRNA pseudouridine(38-40) synthase TruA [Blattabacterium sp. (Mastotermes darwiniensis)]AER40346.1 putative tRNA pseudouridine synthase A [Blattabacterium sp. (Mastotermes darwiniensis) str. MADAR]MDR1804933.1 tRNA pseudouridine(38-40) synthase TruA [Flavobacteriales bacterium]
MRYFIELAYNGKYYHGWQIQKEVKSVEERLEYCLSKLLKKSINVVGAGRTDKGVHAQQMFAHFDFENNISPNLIRKLNIFLPRSIHVFNIFPVKQHIHARFNAISRIYKYYLTCEKNPFIQDFSWYCFYPLDIEKMNHATKILMKYRDFSSFCKKYRKKRVINNICKIYYAYWSKKDTNFCFTIEANRFLRNMVRSIIGTLIDVGRKKISIDRFIEIIELKNDVYPRSTIVPACGLFLTKIIYPEDIFL